MVRCDDSPLCVRMISWLTIMSYHPQSSQSLPRYRGILMRRTTTLAVLHSCISPGTPRPCQSLFVHRSRDPPSCPVRRLAWGAARFCALPRLAVYSPSGRPPSTIAGFGYGLSVTTQVGDLRCHCLPRRDAGRSFRHADSDPEKRGAGDPYGDATPRPSIRGVTARARGAVLVSGASGGPLSIQAWTAWIRVPGFFRETGEDAAVV